MIFNLRKTNVGGSSSKKYLFSTFTFLLLSTARFNHCNPVDRSDDAPVVVDESINKILDADELDDSMFSRLPSDVFELSEERHREGQQEVTSTTENDHENPSKPSASRNKGANTGTEHIPITFDENNKTHVQSLSVQLMKKKNNEKDEGDDKLKSKSDMEDQMYGDYTGDGEGDETSTKKETKNESWVSQIGSLFSRFMEGVDDLLTPSEQKKKLLGNIEKSIVNSGVEAGQVAVNGSVDAALSELDVLSKHGVIVSSTVDTLGESKPVVDQVLDEFFDLSKMMGSFIRAVNQRILSDVAEFTTTFERRVQCHIACNEEIRKRMDEQRELDYESGQTQYEIKAKCLKQRCQGFDPEVFEFEYDILF